jgi:hypothetical protein
LRADQLVQVTVSLVNYGSITGVNSVKRT